MSVFVIAFSGVLKIYINIVFSRLKIGNKSKRKRETQKKRKKEKKKKKEGDRTIYKIGESEPSEREARTTCERRREKMQPIKKCLRQL